MSRQDVVLTGTAIAQDVMGALFLPGSAVLGLAVEKALERQKNQAISILLDAIAEGERDNIVFGHDDADELVQMLLRFKAATEAGAARQNLKLLAQVIVGLKRNRTLEYDRFSRWANVLETLTRDEILFLGIASRVIERHGSLECLREMSAELSKVFEGAVMTEVATALFRTGLVLPEPTFGGMGFKVSQSLSELGRLANMQSS